MFCPCYFKSARLGCGYLDDPRKQDEGPRAGGRSRRGGDFTATQFLGALQRWLVSTLRVFLSQ